MVFSSGPFSFLSLHWFKASGHLSFAEIFEPRFRFRYLVTKVYPFLVKICFLTCEIGWFCFTEKKRRCSKGMVTRASLFGVGAPEALVIGVVALLVFGPKGLAEVSVLVCYDDWFWFILFLSYWIGLLLSLSSENWSIDKARDGCAFGFVEFE